MSSKSKSKSVSSDNSSEQKTTTSKPTIYLHYEHGRLTSQIPNAEMLEVLAKAGFTIKIPTSHRVDFMRLNLAMLKTCIELSGDFTVHPSNIYWLLRRNASNDAENGDPEALEKAKYFYSLLLEQKRKGMEIKSDISYLTPHMVSFVPAAAELMMKVIDEFNISVEKCPPVFGHDNRSPELTNKWNEFLDERRPRPAQGPRKPREPGDVRGTRRPPRDSRNGKGENWADLSPVSSDDETSKSAKPKPKHGDNKPHTVKPRPRSPSPVDE